MKQGLINLWQYIVKVWRCSNFGRGFHVPYNRKSFHCRDCQTYLGGMIDVRSNFDAVHTGITRL